VTVRHWAALALAWIGLALILAPVFYAMGA
jgi:hypothetical protein